ncbi:GlxA family transcriptional regulator [Nonomuraea fuscirosea]|uniref:GlxA family transcriptional regulator n=1 Tax=Nonomuraea fuscirosea TaxID=1291556 RepID=UPI003437973E
MLHTVAVLAFDGVVAFDLVVPCQVFSAARPGGEPRYEIKVCGPREVSARVVQAPCFRISSDFPLESALDADSIVIPGLSPPTQPPPPPVLDLLRAAAARGVRIASICTGAFVLGAAGLLDGRRVTTHWSFADQLARAFPRATVDPSVLYVDSGQVLTSAGVAAGLDLCLHMIRADHGAAVAAEAARAVVMAPHRQGGQAQFIHHPAPEPDGAALQPLLQWMQHHLHHPLTLTDLAGQARVSVRTLNRQFRAQTGTTPLQWLLAARLDRAREILETSDTPIDRVAHLTGFGSPVTLRRHFTNRLGVSPSAYRTAHRRQGHPAR